MQSGLTIESFQTMEESLSEQVLFYYFTKKSNPSEDVQFKSFPNIYTAISIFKDCEVKISGNDIDITESKGTGYIALTITPDIKPYLISIKGAFEEVSIVLKPIGENYFKPITANGTIFNRAFIEELFAQKNEQQKVLQLDAYLKDHFSPDTALDEFSEMLNAFSAIEENVSLTDFSKVHFIHPKTLHRKFMKYLQITPHHYRQIVQFRRALTNLLSSDTQIGEVAYLHHYFDQSHFNKTFKSLTNLSPKRAPRDIQKLANGKLCFQFL
jgi:AraC-like DNA-binding protein